MEGVTIYETWLDYDYRSIAIFSIVVFTVFLILCICVIIKSMQKDEGINATIGAIFGFIMLVGLLATVRATQLCWNNYTEYCTMTIDDSVPFTEFNKYYEVVKYDGSVYTVKIKNRGE